MSLLEAYRYIKILKITSVIYKSQGSHTGQLDFCKWLADGNTRCDLH